MTTGAAWRNKHTNKELLTILLECLYEGEGWRNKHTIYVITTKMRERGREGETNTIESDFR